MSSPLHGQTCLVTGGGGFLGRNLCQALLAAGCNVRVLDRIAQPSDLENVTWIQGDLTNANDVERALSGVQIVFHTAAIIETITHAPQWFKTQVWNVNVEGTRALIEACQRHHVQR